MMVRQRYKLHFHESTLHSLEKMQVQSVAQNTATHVHLQQSKRVVYTMTVSTFNSYIVNLNLTKTLANTNW